MTGLSRNKRTLLLLSLVVLIISASVYLAIMIGTGPSNDLQNDADLADVQSELDPAIMVRSNRELELISSAGDGTISNPFVIENLTIGDGSPRIDIRFVNVHFVVRNCLLPSHSRYTTYGIYFEDVENGVIESCRIEFRATYSIGLEKSRRCTVRNNTIMGATTQSIHLYDSYDSLIAFNTVSDAGIWIIRSENCTARANTINRARIELVSSENCSLIDNQLRNGSLYIYGDYSEAWHHQFANNSVNGKPVGYFDDISSTVFDISGYSQVFLTRSTNVTLVNGSFSGVYIGILVGFCFNCTVKQNILTATEDGILVQFSEHVTVKNNFLSRINRFSIYLSKSSRCNVEGNQILQSSYGYNAVGLRSSVDCRISSNDIEDTEMGFFVWGSTDSVLVNNSVSRCTDVAVFFYHSYNCSLVNSTVYDNYGAVHILGSDYITVSDCNIFGNTRGGISVYHGDFLSFRNNEIHHNKRSGIAIGLSTNSTIFNNSVYNNERDGILLGNCLGLEMRRNRIANNSYSGVVLRTSSECLLTNNSIYGNLAYGVNINQTCTRIRVFWNRIGWNNITNAIDDGEDTMWDDGWSLGNSWSDYNGTGVYTVPGTAGAVQVQQMIAKLHGLELEN
ncbi:MAG: right-handed parallel beta-helix repeat-containing protein [Candidatus Thorarchaeota archaeon]|jgi:parallel beta-helix repeat protein